LLPADSFPEASNQPLTKGSVITSAISCARRLIAPSIPIHVGVTEVIS